MKLIEVARALKLALDPEFQVIELSPGILFLDENGHANREFLHVPLPTVMQCAIMHDHGYTKVRWFERNPKTRMTRTLEASVSGFIARWSHVLPVKAENLVVS